MSSIPSPSKSDASATRIAALGGPNGIALVLENRPRGPARYTRLWPPSRYGTARSIEPSRSKSAAAIVVAEDRKSTRLNYSHGYTSYAVFCLKKKTSPIRSADLHGSISSSVARRVGVCRVIMLMVEDVLSLQMAKCIGAAEPHAMP